MTPRDQLHNLENEVSNRVEKALRLYKSQLATVLRDRQQATLEQISAIEPELPESLVEADDLQWIKGEAEALGRSSAFEDLLEILRSLDRSDSQASVLTNLLQGVTKLASRAAFFLLRGGEVHGWGYCAAGEELRSLSSSSWTCSGSWQSIAEGAGATLLSESEREQVATHLDGLTAEESVLVPFVLRDSLAGVLYVDGAGKNIAAVQILTFAAAQAVEILPLRKRSETATLLGPDTLEESLEPSEVPVPLLAVAEPEVEVETAPEPEIAPAPEEPSEPETEAIEPEIASAPEEPSEPETEAIEPEIASAPEEPSEPVAEAAELEVAEEAGDEPEPSEPVYEPEPEPEPEAPAIQDAASGGWTLEDAEPESVPDAAETAPVVLAPPVEAPEPTYEEEPELATEPTRAEPEPSSDVEVPPLEVDPSPELDSTAAEDSSLEPPSAYAPTGEETVLIRPPALSRPEPIATPETSWASRDALPTPSSITPEPPASTEVTPPAPIEVASPISTEVQPPASMEVTPRVSTEVHPPASMEVTPPVSTEVQPPASMEVTPPATTEVRPPPDSSPGIESPRVVPPADLEGPGRAFATTRLPIDAEQVQAHEEARRLARLLVSEIKLYNEDEVEEGRRTGDVYPRLKDDIDRSRQMFEERIEPEVKNTTDYFYQELVRILGGGDADALGMP